MKTKKLFSMFTTGILVTTLLVACSSKQSNSNKVQSVEDVKTVSFIQLANGNKEQIWYDLYDSNGDGEISKDDDIDTIYITKDGKIDTYFIRDELTLSDVKDKSNNEIKELAKQQDQATFSARKEEVIPSSGSAVSDSNDFYEEQIALWERTQDYINAHPEEYPDPDEELRKASEELTRVKEEKSRSEKSLRELEELTYSKLSTQYLNKPVKATVETDSTGNTVIEENFEFWAYSIDPDYGEVEVESRSQNFTTTISGQIYDTHYVGYVNPEEFTGNDSFLVTAVSSDLVLIVFDPLDTKNVTEE